MDNDRWSLDGENEDTDDVFKHDEMIERYLENPDAVIADAVYRFIFKVEAGCITDGNIKGTEEIIRDTAIDYEYPFHGVDVTDKRIEIKLEISVNEAPLESAKRFQERLERAGISTELVYVGTLGK